MAADRPHGVTGQRDDLSGAPWLDERRQDSDAGRAAAEDVPPDRGDRIPDPSGHPAEEARACRFEHRQWQHCTALLLPSFERGGEGGAAPAAMKVGLRARDLLGGGETAEEPQDERLALLAAAPRAPGERRTCLAHDLLEGALYDPLADVELGGDLLTPPTGGPQGQHVATDVRERRDDFIDEQLQVHLVLQGNQLLDRPGRLVSGLRERTPARVDREGSAAAPLLVRQGVVRGGADPGIDGRRVCNGGAFGEEVRAGALHRLLDLFGGAVWKAFDELRPQGAPPPAAGGEAREQFLGRVRRILVEGGSGCHHPNRGRRSNFGPPRAHDDSPHSRLPNSPGTERWKAGPAYGLWLPIGPMRKQLRLLGIGQFSPCPRPITTVGAGGDFTPSPLFRCGEATFRDRSPSRAQKAALEVAGL